MNAAVAVKLNDETKARIKHLATVKQRSAHWLMREAIETYLAIEEEKAALYADAHKAWLDYQETGLHLTGEEVFTWLDTWGTENEMEAPKCHK
jgi:predicted transcriptional regulator